MYLKAPDSLKSSKKYLLRGSMGIVPMIKCERRISKTGRAEADEMSSHRPEMIGNDITDMTAFVL